MTATQQNPERPTNALREDLGFSAPWYRYEIGPRLRPATRALFDKYCGLSDSELERHLYSIREQAWKIRQYPCVGQWGFLIPGIAQSSDYGTVLDRLKSGQSFLDLGCCMAQDLRRLAADGAPTANMYATDIVPDFWEIGYDLFRDRDTLKAQFIKADVLEEESGLDALDGSADLVYAGSLLHLFGWEKQIQACKRIARMSKLDTMVLGCQIGRACGEEVETKWGGGSTMYDHNADSFRELWRQVGEETGTRWIVKAELGDLKILGLEKEDIAWMRPGNMLLQFSVIRQHDVQMNIEMSPVE